MICTSFDNDPIVSSKSHVFSDMTIYACHGNIASPTFSCPCYLFRFTSKPVLFNLPSWLYCSFLWWREQTIQKYKGVCSGGRTRVNAADDVPDITFEH